MKMKTLCSIVLIGFLAFGNIYGQAKISEDYQHRYHVVDIEELSDIGGSQRAFSVTVPPTGIVQSIAEFEEMQGVIVSAVESWGGNISFGVPVSFLAEITLSDTLYCLVGSSSWNADISTYLQNNGADISRVVYVEAPLDSYWARDYSPWFIRDGNDISIVNFPYNRPRPNDDDVPIVMANHLGTSLYGMNLLHTGGNYMTDGMGKGASTDLVPEENTSMTTSEIDTMVWQYLGLIDYELNPDPLDDYIKHIDCWGKYLGVDKILISSVAITDYRYADYEAIADYYANKASSYGTNYKVYRAYAPDGQPYSNSLILNNRVFIPFVDGNGSQWNDSAKAIYEDAMPGYEVIGVPETQYQSWYSTDALHCRTHGVADLGLLHIQHIPLYGLHSFNAQGIEIEAHIKAYSDSGLVADSLLVYYKNQSSTYQSVPLMLDSANKYTTMIPVNWADTIDYYIGAADNSGRSARHPRMAAHEPHQFFIEENVQSVADNKEGSLFKLFPNPGNGVFYLKTQLENVEIFDMQGRQLYSKELNGNTYQRFDFSHWEKGVYLVRVSGGNSVETIKWIIE